MMRIMNLLELLAPPTSSDDCVKVYLDRLPADDALWPHVSLVLAAYMTWPNDEAARDSFIATYLTRFIQSSLEEAAPEISSGKAPKSRDWIALEKFGGLGAVVKPAFDHLAEEIAKVQRRWLLVADIFQLIVDMAYDNNIALRRGSSISKAIDLCEIERGLPGHSQLRQAWRDFRDVAHLIAAGAYLAHKGLADAASVAEASIMKAIWIAPDAVLTMAAGLQDFGLQPKSTRGESPILRPDTLWRIPTGVMPEKPFITFRRLTKTQLAFLDTRRATKKYIPAHAPI
jgi:hypothetical protein